MFKSGFSKDVSSSSLLDSLVSSRESRILEAFHRQQEREREEKFLEMTRRYFGEKEREKQEFSAPKLASIPDYLQPKNLYQQEGDSVYIPSSNVMTKIYAHNENGYKHFDLINWVPKVPNSTLEHFRFDAKTGKLKDRKSI